LRQRRAPARFQRVPIDQREQHVLVFLGAGAREHEDAAVHIARLGRGAQLPGVRAHELGLEEIVLRARAAFLPAALDVAARIAALAQPVRQAAALVKPEDADNQGRKRALHPFGLAGLRVQPVSAPVATFDDELAAGRGIRIHLGLSGQQARGIAGRNGLAVDADPAGRQVEHERRRRALGIAARRHAHHQYRCFADVADARIAAGRLERLVEQLLPGVGVDHLQVIGRPAGADGAPARALVVVDGHHHVGVGEVFAAGAEHAAAQRRRLAAADQQQRNDDDRQPAEQGLV